MFYFCGNFLYPNSDDRFMNFQLCYHSIKMGPPPSFDSIPVSVAISTSQQRMPNTKFFIIWKKRPSQSQCKHFCKESFVPYECKYSNQREKTRKLFNMIILQVFFFLKQAAKKELITRLNEANNYWSQPKKWSLLQASFPCASAKLLLFFCFLVLQPLVQADSKLGNFERQRECYWATLWLVKA